ncbi:unnamed protein product [Amoebophrya sp. A120]|nr:unnamed protein product [Amoebophrya sp. A120]|eukprot:GSA120T00012654001.1
MSAASVATWKAAPSPAYGAWVEGRVRTCLTNLEARATEEVNARRRSIERDPSKTADILKQGSALAETIKGLSGVLDRHTACLRAARAGKFCEHDDLSLLGVTSCCVWTPGKAVDPATTTDTEDGGGQLPAPPDEAAADRFAFGTALEECTRTAVRAGGGRVSVNIKRSPSLHSSAVKTLGDEILQDQMRAWMVAVRRGFGKPALMPNFPAELFRRVCCFLQPVSDVILGPKYLANVAIAKRRLDVESAIEVVFAQCLESDTLVGSASEIRGSIQVDALPGTSAGAGVKRITVKLGGDSCMLDGAKTRWPALAETLLASYDVWEQERQKDLAARHSVIRPLMGEVKYDVVSVILKDYFAKKGLEFSVKEMKGGHAFGLDFAVSWK